MGGTHKKRSLERSLNVHVQYARKYLKALLHLSQELTRKLAASIFNQSQSSKPYFNDMQALAGSLHVGLCYRVLYSCTTKGILYNNACRPQLAFSLC